MVWVLIAGGIIVTIALSAWKHEPCACEKAGYPCKSEKGQKCESEK